MRRTLALGLVCAAVLLAHAWIGRVVGAAMARIADGAGAAQVERIDVAFVRELAPAAPPVAAAVAVVAPDAPQARPTRPRPPVTEPIETAETAETAEAVEPIEPQASAPEPAVLAVLPVPDPVASASAPAFAEPVVASDAASDVASDAASGVAAASEPGFVWPPSTRLNYDLSGYYRGDMAGVAQVEWIRQGPRYQVHVDLRIGAAFAPLFTRRMSSEGALTAQGLQPQLYEETSKLAFREERQLVIRFQPDRIVLPRGRGTPPRAADWPGVQDSASQFVQFTWLFTTQPQRLVAGGMVDMPLALPRSVERWSYDIVGEETVYTPAGPVQAWHVRPRRETQPGGDLTVALWVAPTLQYLPVRIRIRQDAETYMELTLSRLPQQAER